MHELFVRQLDKARRSSGETDFTVLARLVSLTYEEADRERIHAERAIALMMEELEVRNKILQEREAELQRRAEARIAYMAHHDSLTDLPNRATFMERLALAIDRAGTHEQFCVLCLDLDGFKEINDTFGYSTGDALLREVSRRFLEVSRGAFVARLGGDEFMAISSGPQPLSAEALAAAFHGVTADAIEVEGERLRLSLSIGLSIYPNDGMEPARLVRNADAALYRAKAEGRGLSRFFDADMDKRVRERRALLSDLRGAGERGELTLFYQPQAKIRGNVIGFEALVRWRHPTRGLIPPGMFIPLAEESGMIIPMGEWILREACREAASWPRPLQIAVNLSPIQFMNEDLACTIHSVLLETGLAAERLELEITENVLIDDFSRAVAVLRQLKSLGVGIAMDDFGTGYSSLSYLQSFPFDKIKIDGSFISNVHRSPQSAAIVRAVIHLGRVLDLPVAAEGVETQDQFAFLAREQCDEVQGFLIGRPSPILEYASLLGEHSAPV